MRYDRNYAYFRPHFDWYTFEKGVGYVPTEKAPEDAVKAMKEYNSYTYANKATSKIEDENA